MKSRLLGVVAAVAVLAGAIGATAVPAAAEPIISASDVSAAISAPASGAASFPVTGTITNTGLFSQNAGSTLTISATNGAVISAPGCSVAAGAATCTAGALSPGAGQSWTVTVAPNAGAVSVTSTATAVAANGELNVFPDNANNTATAITGVVYTVDAALSSAPSTVRNGDDTLLTATVTNTGATQNITLSVATGGKYDNRLALPAGCSASGSGATVTCTQAYSSGQARSFDIAVITPSTGTSMVSTATANGALGGSDSASTTTGLYSDATAFVPEGGQLSATGPDSTQTFYVRQGSARGLPLDLNQVAVSPTTMCGATACESYAVEALFPNSGPYSGSDPNHPFEWDLSYGKLACNGGGAPKCIDVLYVILSGQTTPTKLVQCQTFGQATAVLRNVNEVCLQKATKAGNGVWTFRLALLRDIVIPIIGGVSSGA